MNKKTIFPMLAYRLPYGKFLKTEWETLEFIRDAGINLIVISPMNTANSLGDAYSDYPPVWQWLESYDFASLDRQFEDVLCHHPHARFLVTIDLNSPLWLARRPEQNADSFCQLSHCSLHREWKELTTRYLNAFLDHCETCRADQIEGYILACGRTLEWLEVGNLEPSALKNAGFPLWCREHGFLEFPVPEDPIRQPKHKLIFDPETEAAHPAWRQYVNSLTADLVIHFVSTARKRIRREAKIGIFYSLIHGCFCNGQLECERALDIAPPDFVIGAACNTSPAIGGNSGYIGVTRMLERRGINFMFECDRITSTANLKMSEFVTLSGGIWNTWKNPADDVAGLKRELGMALVNRLSFWYFNIWGGIYRGEECRELVRRSREVWEQYMPLATGSAAEILLVLDPESNYHLHNQRYILSLGEMEECISRSGLPHDTATMRDLEYMDPAPYRMIIFQTLFRMDEKRRKLLETKIGRDRRTVVFIHSPGILHDGLYDPAAVEQLTGVPFNSPGIHVIEQPQRRIVYAATPELLTPEALRTLAQTAGVHFYCREGAFQASREFLMVHQKEGGRIKIDLPAPAEQVTEIFSGKLIAENCTSFEDWFQSPDTKIYHFR